MSFLRTKSIHILISFLILSSLLISCTNPEEEEDNSDRTAPTSSFSFSPSGRCTVDASADATTDAYYLCTGPVKVTVSSNESGRIYYGLNVGSYAITTNGTAPVDIAVNANNSWLVFYPRDAAGNNGASKNLHFTIQGVTPNVNAGYYKTLKKVEFELSSDRHTSNNYPLQDISEYELWLRQSIDTTALLNSIFDPAPSARDAKSYVFYDNFGEDTDINELDKFLAATSGDTNIYEFKYNILYDPDGDGTADTSDEDGYAAYYIDQDIPNVMALPASSGTLDATMDVKVYLQDDGYDKLLFHNETNSFLNTAAPIKPPEADYCTPGSGQSPNSDDFWEYCLEKSSSGAYVNRIDLILDVTNKSITNAIDISGDTYLPLAAIDPAMNRGRCYADIKSCISDPLTDATNDYSHIVERYTTGRLHTQAYHDVDLNNGSPSDGKIKNFGQSMAVGDLDGDGKLNDIVIGAPAYSTITADATSPEAKGAVYVWYGAFRERALRSFSLNATENLTNETATVSTDGNANLTICFDPNDGTCTPGTAGEFRALSSDYTNGVANATIAEIASVLNRAFLSSLKTPTYSNPLFVTDSSTDITIGHRNQTLQGYFSFSSTFASLNYASPIRAYDLMYYGENEDDQFGYSVAIGSVNSGDATTIKKQIIVGAPGFNGNQGKVYVIFTPPESAADAGYSQIQVDTTSNAHGIEGEEPGGIPTAGKFGFSVEIKNIDDSSTDLPAYQELFISAPELTVSGNAKAGKVYALDEQGFSSRNQVIETSLVANRTVTELDTPTGLRANSLFGYSLVSGVTPRYSDMQLFVGAPGVEPNSLIEGFVYNFDLSNALGSSWGESGKISEGSSGSPANLFGYSLDINESSQFDDSETPSYVRKCPCLIIGSPYSGNDQNGRVYLQGKNSLWTYLEGSAGERMGVAVYAGKFGTSPVESIFIGSKGGDLAEGKLTIIQPQELSNPTFNVAASFTGEHHGGRLGSSFTSIKYTGNDGQERTAIVVGSSGQGEEDPIRNDPFRIGEVNIFSYGRFFNNQE